MKTCAVIGLGLFGSTLVDLLNEAGCEVIAIDQDPELLETFRDRSTRAICLDATDEAALKSQGVDKVDVAVISIGADFENALLTTVLLKQLGIPRVIARATSPVRGQILSRVGADEIVSPESEAAMRWRDRLLSQSLTEWIELAEDFSLVRTTPPTEMTGKSLAELDIRKKYGIQIVAIRRTISDVGLDGVKRTHETVLSAMPDTVLQAGDVMMLIGPDEALKKFTDR